MHNKYLGFDPNANWWLLTPNNLQTESGHNLLFYVISVIFMLFKSHVY